MMNFVKNSPVNNNENFKMESTITIDFGKYKGKTLEYLMKNDVGYYIWAYKNIARFKNLIETLSLNDKTFIENEVKAYRKRNQRIPKSSTYRSDSKIKGFTLGIPDDDEEDERRYLSGFTVGIPE